MNAPFKMQFTGREESADAAMLDDLARAPGSAKQTDQKQFEAELLELTPFLRSFARNLTRDRELAEDLAQDTLLSAWRARSSFTLQTNLKAWLCIIMRNRYYSHLRRSWRQAPWNQAAAEQISSGDPRQ